MKIINRYKIYKKKASIYWGLKINQLKTLRDNLLNYSLKLKKDFLKKVNNFKSLCLKAYLNVKKRITNLFLKNELQQNVEDLLNRKPYAIKIAEIIEKYHTQDSSDNNITFSISGKWGSGKSTILNLLKPILIRKGFKVVWFDSWKYSQEPISLKRAFLKTLNEELDSRVDLKNLDSDISEVIIPLKIFISILFALTTITLGILFFYLYLKSISHELITTIDFINYLAEQFQHIIDNKIVQIVIFPLFLFLIRDIFSIKKTTSKLTTSEAFLSKFVEIVKHKKKIVVFIDDLDRCTPIIVKQILDALITFFKNKNCSFVVTGDHTVIEQYVGSQISIFPIYDEFGKINEKQTRLLEKSEGRRFLKKLFDIYWQMPPPEPARFKEYIRKMIEKLKIKNLKGEKVTQLVYLLSTYFEPNPRAIIRFLTSLSFDLETLSYMIDEKEKEKGKINKINDGILLAQVDLEIQGLKEVIGEPTLLAKVLLLQELFSNLYDLYVKQPSLYHVHEKEAREEEISTLFKGSIAFKDAFIRKEDLAIALELLTTPPTFINQNDKNSTVIFNANNFFYLSGFTGLPSEKGPDEEQFLRNLKAEVDAKDLIISLEAANETRQKKLLDISQKSIATASISEKNNIIKNMLDIFLKIKNWSSGYQFIVNYLTENNVFNTIPTPLKEEIAFKVLIFSFQNNIDIEKLFSNPPWNDPSLIPTKWKVVEKLEKISKELLKQLVNISLNELSVNEAQGISNLNLFLNKINQDDEEIVTLIKPVFDQVLTSLFKKTPDNQRSMLLDFLDEFDTKRLVKTNLVTSLIDRIKVKENINEIKYFFEYEKSLSNYLENNDTNKIKSEIIAVFSNYLTVDWYTVADTLIVYPNWQQNEKDYIINAFFKHMNNPDDNMFNYAFEYLKKAEIRTFYNSNYLFRKYFQSINTFNEQRKEKIILYLAKENWKEISILDKKYKSIFLSLARSKNMNIIESVRNTLGSWGFKLKQKKKENVDNIIKS